MLPAKSLCLSVTTASILLMHSCSTNVMFVHDDSVDGNIGGVSLPWWWWSCLVITYCNNNKVTMIDFVVNLLIYHVTMRDPERISISIPRYLQFMRMGLWMNELINKSVWLSLRNEWIWGCTRKHKIIFSYYKSMYGIRTYSTVL